MKTSKQILHIFSLILLIIATIFSLSSCSLSCEHQWKDPTCTSPKTCQLCEKTQGIATGHQFNKATCTEPKTCSICKTIEGNAIGHIEGGWAVTKKATLIDKGIEELSCSVCNESLNSRTIKKKTPKVENDYFNFTDDEFIDWINDKSTAYVSHTDLGLFDDDSSNTSYRITDSDGTNGAFILNHGDNGKNGNIKAIMIYFESTSASGAMGIWIGNKIDSDFDVDNAITKFIYNRPYTAADMTGVKLELDDDFIVYLLAPSEYVDDLLS